MRFIDEVRLTASSGDGGDGAALFRKEKFVPRGGPNGGDGGRGGHIVFVGDRNLNTLHHLRFTPILKAKRGNPGGNNNKTGRGGADKIIPVPVGTTLTNVASGELIAELTEDGAEVIVLEGGRGGRGNARFTTSQNRAPTRAEPGAPGITAELQLELKLLADVGLLGFPNAGKSTLISRISAARPKVAAYPFTTLEPSLGVVAVPGQYRTFVVADIPGLIEGAAEGVGLGHRFLRHVERCRLLLHLVSLDAMEDEVHGAPLERFDKLNGELERYASELAQRPQVVLLSKSDLVSEETITKIQAAFAKRGVTAHVASSATGAGINELIYAIAAVIDAAAEESS